MRSTYTIIDLCIRYGLREYITVMAEKAMKHSNVSKIRNTPQSGRFITISSVSIYLKILRFCRNFLIRLIGKSNINLNCIIIWYDLTVLSPDGDVCSRSVVSACAGTFPLRHDPVPVPPVVQPVSHSPALL
jgi:hypothetical protein